MMLILRTLGFLDLRSPDGGEMTRALSQPKRLALLIYLAVDSPGAFHRRDTLLSVFWPEVPEEKARNSLSQALAYLRRHLPDGTLRMRGIEEVGVGENRVLADVAEFDSACREGRWADGFDLYNGDFLRGFHVPGSPSFCEWALKKRHRLKDAASDAAWALAREQLERGAWEEAVRSAQCALNLCCLNESAVRVFLEALGETGDRVAVVGFYERFRSKLRTEFEMEPSPETEDLVGAIRKGRPWMTMPRLTA